MNPGKNRTFATKVVWLLIAFVFTCCGTARAADQLSAERARLILLTHLQAPDRTFSKKLIKNKSLDGHLEYEFYGDAGGTYRIDAVCGATLVDHAKQSTVPLGEMAAKALPPAQLERIAREYVATHFPGYKEGMFKTYSGKVDPGTYNLYEVDFYMEAPSGAEIPESCKLEIEEDTGAIRRYDATSVPITISAEPKLSKAQAIFAGQEWIRRNVTLNPEMAEVCGPPEPYPVRLKVDIDPLLHQTLLYEIMYRRMVLEIDAQTGTVISHDLYAHDEEGPRRKWGKSARFPETLWTARFANGEKLTHDAVEIAGTVFLWQQYARDAGIEIRQGSESVELECKGKRVLLLLTRESSGSTDGAWLRNGVLYLPVDQLTRLIDRIRLNEKERTVTIIHPYAYISPNKHE